MNLNKQQQQLFTQLNNILKAVRTLTQDPVVIKDTMLPWVIDFESSVGADVRVRYSDDTTSEFVLIDCSRDSLKSIVDSQQALIVRARSENILVAITAARSGQYAHTNKAIADALEALAQQLRNVPFEIVEKGACDIYAELGVQHSNSEGVSDGEQSLEPEEIEPQDIDPVEPTQDQADPEAGVISLVQIPGEADPV